MAVNPGEIFIGLLEPAGRANPYPLYSQLRELGDVLPIMPGEVAVTGYDAISSVLRDPQYRVTDGAWFDEHYPEWREHPSFLGEAILDLNEPEHGRIRRLIGRAFTPRRIAGFESAIARMTDDLVRAMIQRSASGEPVEFMHDFAFLLPVTVICELIGIPESDIEWFRPLARDIATTLEFNVDPPTMARADVAAVELMEYFGGLAAERRASPRDDLMSALVSVTDAADGRLSDTELMDNLILLLIAGFETTTNLLGNGLQIVLQDRRLGCAIRSGSIPIAAFVEEVLRYDSPVQLTSRRRRDACQIAGVRVEAGDEIVLMIGAGNRDERRFTDSDTFNPQRAVSGPLSFGGGAHFCAGAALARLEAAIAFPRLLRRLPDLAAAGEPKRRDGLVLRGFDTLPVTLS
jgi:cytochrome P450